MTREEAKKEFWKKDGVFEKMFKYCLDKVLKLPYKGSVVDAFIDKIYNDFENRTCKNCKWLDEKRYECKNTENYQEVGNYDDVDFIFMQVDEDFGCNRFERREDED